MNLRSFSVLLAFLFLVLGYNNCTPFAVGIVTENASSTEGEGAAPPPAPEILTQDVAKLSITTENSAPVDSKDIYVNGHVSMIPNGTAVANTLEADMKIKGRGNFTWTLAKKPFKIKLNSKASVMGMPEDKEWVLLANHTDRTLFRTSLAFEFSRRVGADYTPRLQTVDVTLNGVDLGNYSVTESIKIAASRVNVTELKATDVSGDALTGGYLVELDQRLDEVVNWRTTRGIPYTLKEPSAATVEQQAYIKDYIQQAEDVLNSAGFADPVDGYAKFIDVDSFINLYLVHELFKNKDAADFSSIFFYKERLGKLKMGPAWDFDLAAGNSDVLEINDPVGWLLRTRSPWFTRLFQDPAFEAKVRAKWNSLKNTKIDTLDAYIDKQAYQMSLAQARNFNVWPILNYAFFPASIVPGTYQGEVDKLKTWLKTRVAWMDSQINPTTP
ncbi:hypothetical protein BH10BDE1_BH10BDE1_12770 [soil metagenome]